MADPELGLKRLCVSCGTRFYDLTNVPAICPKCGTEQPTDFPRSKRPGDVPVAQPKPQAADGNEEDVDLGSEEESGDDVLEDTSDLDDDDDDLGNEIEVDTDNDNDDQ